MHTRNNTVQTYTTPPIARRVHGVKNAGRSSGSSIIILQTFPVSQWYLWRTPLLQRRDRAGFSPVFPFHWFTHFL